MVLATNAAGGTLTWKDRRQLHMQIPSSRCRSAKIGYGLGIDTAILRTSRALHEEAETFLYQLHEFDFSSDVFAIIPFLRCLSHNARQNISCLTVYLLLSEVICARPQGPWGLTYLGRPNTLDWGLACSYIACHVRLREFAFHIEGETPEDFQHLRWVQDMVQIKRLQKLTYYEHKNINWQEELDFLRTEDEDRLTTGISDQNQALLSYLRSQMLEAPPTRC